jgi:hypothetical protein
LVGVDLALVVELLALQLELAGLDLEELGLLPRQFLLVVDLPLNRADFCGLLQEGSVREMAVTIAPMARTAVAAAVSWVAKRSDMAGRLRAGLPPRRPVLLTGAGRPCRVAKLHHLGTGRTAGCRPDRTRSWASRSGSNGP